MKSLTTVGIEIDVLGCIIGYSFGGMQGLGIAATILLLWTFWGMWK